MAGTSSNPWEEPLDESYWRTLLIEVERIASPVQPSSPDHQTDTWFEDSAGARGSQPDVPGRGAVEGHAPLGIAVDATDGQVGEAGYRHDPEDDWEQATRLFEAKDQIHLEVVGYNRGGLLVNLGQIQGFVPASQLRELPDDLSAQSRQAELAHRVGDELCLRVIELDAGRNRLILSERAPPHDLTSETLLNTLAPGQIRRGQIRSLCGFGAFVDLGGVEGFIHISEFSWGRINHPSDMLDPGDEVEVYVMNVQPAQGRVSLSLKRLSPDPWTLVDERFQVGQMVQGEVTNVVSFGAFVRVAEGLEGLIHISELAEGNFLHPRNVVGEGDVVTARIIRIDSANHRLGLSLRQVCQPE